MIKDKKSDRKLYNFAFGLWLVYALLIFLPLIYLPGYFTHSIWKYFVFGTSSIILSFYTLKIWFFHPQLPKVIFSHLSRYALLLFFAGITIAAIVSVNPIISIWSSFQGLDGWFAYLFLVTFSLAVATLIAANGKLAALNMMKYSVAGSVLLSLLILASSSGLGHWFTASRGGATIGNSSLAAAYITWNIFFGLIILFNAERLKSRVLWVLGLIAICLSPLFFNWHAIFGWTDISNLISYVGDARASIISIGIGMAISFSTWLLFRSKRLRVIGICLLIFITSLLFFVTAQLANPNSNVRKEFVQLNGDQRLVFWSISKKAISENPILGWGPSTYDIVFHQKYEPRMLLLQYPENLVKNPHNQFLEILINGGITLFVVSIILWLSVLYSVYQAKKMGELTTIDFSLIVGMFFAWLIQGQLAYDPLVSSVMLFLLIGMSYGLAVKNNFSITNNKVYSIGSTKRNLLIASGVIALPLFWVALYLPIKEARLMKAMQESALPQRIQMWDRLGKSSPIVTGYDSVRFVDTILRTYEAQKNTILRGDAKKREYAIEEINAINKYLLSLAIKDNSHPAVVLITARAYLLLMQMQQNHTDETVLEANKLADLVIKSNPTDPRSFWTASQLKLTVKEFDQSKQLAEKVIAIEPKLPDSYDLLLKIADEQNDSVYYQQVLDRAKEIIPEYKPDSGKYH